MCLVIKTSLENEREVRAIITPNCHEKNEIILENSIISKLVLGDLMSNDKKNIILSWWKEQYPNDPLYVAIKQDNNSIILKRFTT